MAVRNNELEWFNNLKDEDIQMEKAYDTERHVAEKEVRKLKFCMKTFKEVLVAESGTEAIGQSKLMWYGEYKEWGQKAEAGFLSIEEIDINWNRWKKDKDKMKASDMKGPRGTLRIPILVADFVNDVNRLSLKRELEQQEKLIKNITAEDLQNKIQQHILSGHETTALGDMA